MTYNEIREQDNKRKLLLTLSVEERIAYEIIDDLRDRRGLKHQFESIDEEIQDEIFEAWKQIISENLCP